MKLPQLSLRELFLLVALVAMGCGWWVDHRGLAGQNGLLAIENEVMKMQVRRQIWHFRAETLRNFLFNAHGTSVLWTDDGLRTKQKEHDTWTSWGGFRED